ncbi:MAG: hypothetical protein AAB250_01375, partial [Bdellovibrionota bacterium]
MRILSVLLILAVSATAHATNWDVIDPIGNELLGNLVVTSPSAATIPSKQVMPSTITTVTGPSTKSVTPDLPTRILAGEYCVQLHVIGTQAFSKKCIVRVVKKQTTTIGLSAFRFDWDRTKFATNVGPAPSVLILGDSEFKSESLGSDAWMGRPAPVFAPGFDTRFSVQVPGFTIFQAQHPSIRAGEAEAVALAFPDLRTSLGLKFSKHVFPDPTTCPTQPYLVQRTAAQPNARFHVPFDVYVNGRWDQSGRVQLASSYAMSEASPSAKY